MKKQPLSVRLATALGVIIAIPLCLLGSLITAAVLIVVLPVLILLGKIDLEKALSRRGFRKHGTH